MKLLSIIKYSVLRKIRDRKSLILMILLPIILIGTFGIVFQNIMNPDKSIGEIKIGIVSNKNANLEKDYVEFLKSIKLKEGFDQVSYKILSSNNIGKETLVKSEIDLLVEFKENNVNLSKSSSRRSIIAESITKDFVEKSQIINLAVNKGEEKLSEVSNYINKNYVEFKGIRDKYEIKALDFYGITILMFTIFLGGTYGVNGISHLKENRGRRILISPIKKREVFLGEFLSASIFLVIQTLIVMCFSSIVFEVNYGRDPLIILPIILQCFLSVSIGMCIGSYFKVEAIGQSIIILITIILSFAGGVFIPLNPDSIVEKISLVLPNKHILDSIFNIIGGCYNGLITSFLITVFIVIICLGITGIKYSREEA